MVSLPEFRVARSPLGKGGNSVLVSVVNCVVCVVTDGDQILRIKNIQVSALDVIRCNRVHVMYEDPIIDFEALDTQITT